MKNKLNKTRKITYALIGVGAIALTSVGFATWVIAKQDIKSTGNVSVSVGEVQDQTLAITLLDTDGVDDNNASVKFDAVIDNEGDITSTDGGEDLTFAIKFSIDMKEASYFHGITVAASSTDHAKFTNWVNNGWIVLPFSITSDGSVAANLVDKTWTSAGDYYVGYATKDKATSEESLTNNFGAHVNVTENNTVRTYTITIGFKWGSKFNNQNPVLEKGTNAEEALTALTDFAKEGTPKFNLKLTHNPRKDVSFVK